jgi:hypothetical protein
MKGENMASGILITYSGYPRAGLAKLDRCISEEVAL